MDASKVLNCSLLDYAKVLAMQKENNHLMPGIEDYEIVGVHTKGASYGGDVLGTFLKSVPDNAEVVVGYKVTLVSESGCVAIGTALIKK